MKRSRGKMLAMVMKGDGGGAWMMANGRRLLGEGVASDASGCC